MMQDWLNLWTGMKWYWKVLIVLIILRILNIFYRMFIESPEARKRRLMIDSGELNLKKLYTMKSTMREIETFKSSPMPLNISQINGNNVENDKARGPYSYLSDSLAILWDTMEKMKSGMVFIHKYVYELFYLYYSLVMESY